METLLILIWILLIWICPIYITYKIAKRKNLNYEAWTVGAFFFGWWVVLFVAISRKRDKQ